MSLYKSFETERLFLRPTSEEDASLIYELLNTPKWIRYIGDRKVKSVEDAQEYIRSKMQPQLERLGFSSYTIVRKSDNVKAGICGLYDREGLEGIDIGFALLPEFEGQGYAYESASEMKRAAVKEFGISVLSAITTRENVASQKLLKKLGFNFEKMVRLQKDDEELMLFTYKTEINLMTARIGMF